MDPTDNPADLATAILHGRDLPAGSLAVTEHDLAPLADAIDALLARDGQGYVLQRIDLPAGWLGLVLCALTAARFCADQAGAPLALKQCKEKLGELRLWFQPSGMAALDADLARISDWAQAVSARTCALSGEAGTMTTERWIIPLSDAAARLQRQDREEFRRRVRLPPRA